MATIASLSPETLAHILSYIPRDHDDLMVRLARIRDGGPIKPTSELPPYATVCKTWQWHIEQRTFREINLPSSELEYFSKLLTGYRRAALREVKYQVVLPEYDDAACGVVETEEDKKVNNTAFTTAVTELFRLVKGWEEEDEQELSGKGFSAREGLVPLSLEMSQIYSPSDAKKRNSALLREQHIAVERGERSDLFDGRLCDSWLRLGPLEGVPELKRVTKYTVSPSYPRPVEAESIARLAKKFPVLEKLDLQIMERSEDFEVRRKDRYGTYEHLYFVLLDPLVQCFHSTHIFVYETPVVCNGYICSCCKPVNIQKHATNDDQISPLLSFPSPRSLSPPFHCAPKIRLRVTSSKTLPQSCSLIPTTSP